MSPVARIVLFEHYGKHEAAIRYCQRIAAYCGWRIESRRTRVPTAT